MWIHSHGMQKFGLPDIEMEGIPGELASSGLTLMIMIAETLLKVRRKAELDFASSLEIANMPFLFRMEVKPGDAEGHFPAGSLKILPYVYEYDPHSPDTLKHVLKMVVSRFRLHPRKGRRTESPSGGLADRGKANAGVQALKEELLAAHRKARSELAGFKRSFLARDRSGNQVYAGPSFPTCTRERLARRPLDRPSCAWRSRMWRPRATSPSRCTTGSSRGPSRPPGQNTNRPIPKNMTTNAMTT